MSQTVDAKERFLRQLGEGVIAGGGAYYTDKEKARQVAAEAWAALRRVGTDAYPCMVEIDGIRYIYQWDQHPPVVVVMRWEETMWQDMAHVTVPAELTK